MIEQKLTSQFGINDILRTEQFTSGLINQSYKITSNNGEQYFFQSINTQIFPDPKTIQENYVQIQKHLVQKNVFHIPKLIPSIDNQLFIVDDNNKAWRCMELIKEAYSKEKVNTSEEAYMVASCFGKFTAALSDLPMGRIKTILPGFHDLNLRVAQLKDAIKNGNQKRVQEQTNTISHLNDHSYIIDDYNKVISDDKNFPLHIMHHDSKIANMLFDRQNNAVVTPIDLDTTQPGYYFSDLGDMIRSVIPTIPENNSNIAELEIKADLLKALKHGYLDAMGDHLTEAEKSLLPFAGNCIVYMQAIRFLTDYFNDDIYYQTNYKEQNINRALNQLQLLKKLEKAQFSYR